VSATLRYGLIGTGMMGLEHQRNLNAIEGVEVVAAADPDPVSLDWSRLLAEGRDLVAVSDYRELLDRDMCDVYVISTPNHTHRDVLDEVMQTGKSILVEKPMATTIADAAEIRRRGADYPGVLWVGLEYRYMPPIARAIDVTRSGAIGRPLMVAIREHRHPFLAKVGDWNRFNERTGGTLVEKCCHFFDLMRLIASSEPVSITGFGGQALNHLDESYEGRVPDIIDHALVVVEFANCVRASLDLCMFAEGTTNNEELSIVGETGKVEAFIPSGELRVGQRAGWGRGVATECVTDDRAVVQGFHHGASYLEHLDLAAAVRAKSPALVGVDDGYWSVVMGVAAQRAIEQRRVIDVGELVA